MKIDINDPRITAFALGELKGADARELARAVQDDPRIRAAVEEARETSFVLFESLGGGEAHMLTASQRESVRSAGASPVIEDLASARESFWKKPMVVGVGVAAAVALGVFVVMDRPVGEIGGTLEVVDHTQRWDWSRVEMRELTSPVPVGVGNMSETEATKAVASAISDDTESFREEVERRVGGSHLDLASEQSKLKPNDWLEAEEGVTMAVPMVSGASSWPWFQRYIEERKAMPPKVSIRVEEWLNHFRYQTPDQFTGEQLVADVEVCDTPWNPNSQLLAVHVAARPGVNLQGAGASLKFNADQIRRVRLLGYGQVTEPGDVGGSGVAMSREVSKSQGNYVLYEVELADRWDSGKSMLSIVLGEKSQFEVHRRVSWIHASPDLRFASLVAATAMMASDYGTLAELDAGKLQSMAKLVEIQDAGSMIPKRRDAMKLLAQAAKLLETSE